MRFWGERRKFVHRDSGCAMCSWGRSMLCAPFTGAINHPSLVGDVFRRRYRSRIKLLALPGRGCGTPRDVREVSAGRGLKPSIPTPTAASTELNFFLRDTCLEVPSKWPPSPPHPCASALLLLRSCVSALKHFLMGIIKPIKVFPAGPFIFQTPSSGLPPLDPHPSGSRALVSPS